MKMIFFSYQKEDGYEDVFESDSILELCSTYDKGQFSENIKNVAINGKPASKSVTTISGLLKLLQK